jgi:biopolymer transport protein ExbD
MLALALASMQSSSIKNLPVLAADDQTSSRAETTILSIRLYSDGTVTIDSESVEWAALPERLSNLSNEVSLQVAVETGPGGTGPVQALLKLASVAEQAGVHERIRFLVASVDGGKNP